MWFLTTSPRTKFLPKRRSSPRHIFRVWWLNPSVRSQLMSRRITQPFLQNAALRWHWSNPRIQSQRSSCAKRPTRWDCAIVSMCGPFQVAPIWFSLDAERFYLSMGAFGTATKTVNPRGRPNHESRFGNKSSRRTWPGIRRPIGHCERRVGRCSSFGSVRHCSPTRWIPFYKRSSLGNNTTLPSPSGGRA